MIKIKDNYTIIPNFTLTPESIEKFDVMENRRQIGEAHVTQIHGTLLEGKNPMGILIVNEINKKWRLIDGNHRLEALKRFYGYKEKNKQVSMDCGIKVYHNLTRDEENEVYSIEAKRKNESHEDRIQLYIDTITFWKLLQDKYKEFPCKVSIYGQVDSIRFRLILDALSTAKNQMQKGYAPKYLGKEDIITFARELRYEDFLLMKRFCNIFQIVFGNVGKDNIFSRRQGFVPLFDIFFRNFRNEKEEVVISRFKNIVGKSDILMYLNMQGREAQQTIRSLMVNYINKGKVYSKNAII